MGIITDVLYREHKEKIILQVRQKLIKQGIGLQELHDKLNWSGEYPPGKGPKQQLLDVVDPDNHDTTLKQLYQIAEALGCELTITLT